MKFFSVMALVLMTSSTFASDMQVILSLKFMSGSEVKNKIEFLSNQISPNVISRDDKFQVQIDGKDVVVPENLLNKLQRTSREIRYDSQTGGVTKIVPNMTCLLGGSPRGALLDVLYLEYDQNYVLTGQSMKTVASEAYNCLFNTTYEIKDSYASHQAAKVIAILETIYLLQK